MLRESREGVQVVGADTHASMEWEGCLGLFIHDTRAREGETGVGEMEDIDMDQTLDIQTR